MRFLAAAVALLLATPAHATAILTAVSRYSYARYATTATTFEQSNAATPRDIGAFRENPTSSSYTNVSAGQQLFLIEGGIDLWFDTTIGGSADPVQGFGGSWAELTFALDSPMRASLYGQVSFEEVDPGIGVAVLLTLTGPGGLIVSWSRTDADLHERDKDKPVKPIWHEDFLNLAPVLEPGTYKLFMSMDSDSASSPTAFNLHYANTRLTFAEVPEPGTLALVGVGLAVLARRRG